MQRNDHVQLCRLCWKNVSPNPSFDSLWMPCCKGNSWLHRDCVQDLALNEGNSFKCPLCNDFSVFRDNMQILGIYIPLR